MNEDRNIVEEKIPAGVVTMLLTGYLEANKRLTWALVVAIIALLCSWGGFLYYLSQYEVEVTSYGAFENSRVNTNRGQFNEKVDTFNNYGVDNGSNKK